ncbi:hypothetical protein CVCC1112_3476 [Paenarthrobacter nicotinovorans]|nr:hypothetical protein CVCC1112_3476 [Paenarthrobacter nicotinovorans]
MGEAEYSDSGQHCGVPICGDTRPRGRNCGRWLWRSDTVTGASSFRRQCRHISNYPCTTGCATPK